MFAEVNIEVFFAGRETTETLSGVTARLS